MIHQDLIEAAALLANGASEDMATGQEGGLKVSDRLYEWYLNLSALPVETGPLLPHQLGLAAVLRTAHHDAGQFEGGWRAVTVSTWGRVVAEKGELSRLLERSEYTVPTRRGLRAQPHDALLVSRCWDWVEEETGFWHVRRGQWPPPGETQLVRLYWNCAPAQAAQVVRTLTALLASAPSVPYMVKTPTQPNHVGRADALVLYLGEHQFAALEPALFGAAKSLRPALRPQTPRLTLRLAHGVAMAEGPLDGASFGESRTRLMARAFQSADDKVRQSAEAIAGMLSDAFRGAGLDPLRPYLEPRA